jgi:dTMP kinase
VTSAVRGRLIALEGIDGCGKTTQARRLAAALGALSTHEPGATRLGSSLRRLVLDHDLPTPAPRAEALLVAADKAQHVTEVILPALADGRWVVTDRFSASTLAYQGYGRGLPIGPLRQVVEWAIDGLEPDLTILVDVPPSIGRSRMKTEVDRLERLDDAFFSRVRAGYLELAGADPQHWAVVDGDAPREEVDGAVDAAVRRHWPEERW